MLQILYQGPDDWHPDDSHENRASRLAKTVKGSKYDLVEAKAVRREGLDTLVFWGHSSGNSKLCDKTPSEIAQIVKKWKRVNPGLTTVETLTCDGRHARANEKPLVRKIRTSLRAGMFSSTSGVILKALPVAYAGAAGSASILLADWETDSWCYVSAPSEGMMLSTKGKIIAIALKFYRLRKDDKSSADVAKASGRLFKQKGEGERTYSVNYGYFATLRAHLSVVKKKDVTISSRLHAIE
jgi:hypothetical protein